MISKNWSRRSAIVCATSILAGGVVWAQPAQPAPPQKPAPTIALVDAADAAQWQSLMAGSGWQIVSAPADPDANIDKRVQALALKVEEAVKAGTADASRIYVAGRGDASAVVFYAIARMPDRWAAGVALGGSPKSAIATNRVFAVNFTNTPILWASSGANDSDYAAKLKLDGLNVEWRTSTGLTNQAILEWMAARVRAEYPLTVDCETNSPTFASCYWVQPTKFDAGERNDVLPMTLIPGDAGSAFDLGGFGYRGNDPGPGVTVAFLPEKYNGPLKVGDILEALDGKPIENAHHLAQILEKADATRNAVVMVRRGKDRIRIETRIVVPRRDPVVTARVKAEYMPEYHQIVLISRAVTEMRVTIPAEWIPGDLLWNGLTLENVKTAGCYALKLEKELLHAGPCQ
jgi:predicted esterase